MEDRKTMRARWIGALRSGEYRQGRSALLSGDDEGQPIYCCLGVLAKVCGRSDDELEGYGTLSGPEFLDVRESVGLRTSWADFGEEHDDYSLVVKNDHGMSFAEIADLIESEPARLFVDDGEPVTHVAA